MANSGGSTLPHSADPPYARLVMNGILGGLDPAVVVLAICGLLFVEECGVPLPFAPGDLVLMLGGIAIATQGVNPVLFVVAASLASIAGALVAREILKRAGAPALMKVAARLHVQGPIDRASRLLRHSGWLGVLAGRLMPRRTFLAGLLPAVVIYVGLFTGLGIVIGPTAIAAVEHLQGLLVAGAVVVIVALLLGVTQARLRSDDIRMLAQTRYGYFAA